MSRTIRGALWPGMRATPSANTGRTAGLHGAHIGALPVHDCWTMLTADHVGRRYEAKGIALAPERVRAFAAALAGPEAPPAGSPVDVPPTFAAVYCLSPILEQLFADSELGVDLAGLVHNEQSFEWPSPVAVGDVVDVAGEIAMVKSKAGLTFLTVDMSATKVSGEEVCRGRAVMIIRGVQ